MVRYVRIVVWFMKTVFSHRSFVVDASVAQIDESWWSSYRRVTRCAKSLKKSKGNGEMQHRTKH